MSIATIGRWGRSLAVRLPVDVAGQLSLSEGSAVEVAQRDDEIVIRRASKPRTLGDLFEAMTPEEWRELYRDHAVDWAPDVDREIVDE